MLNEYNRRLARVLDVEPQLTPVPTAPRFPRVRRQLLPPLLAMTAWGNQSPSETFERYVAAVLEESSEHNYWEAFEQAVAQHTRAWQALLDQCGMQPGENRSGQRDDSPGSA